MFVVDHLHAEAQNSTSSKYKLSIIPIEQIRGRVSMDVINT